LGAGRMQPQTSSERPRLVEVTGTQIGNRKA
jgi:hypothetical protein